MIFLLALFSCGKDTGYYHAILPVTNYDVILVIGQSNTHQGIGQDHLLDTASRNIMQLGRFWVNNYRITLSPCYLVTLLPCYLAP